MRISVVTGPFAPLPPGPAGAVEKRWRDLAEEFSKHGHQITLISKSYRSERGCASGSDLVHKTVPGFTRSGYLTVDVAKDFIYSLRAAQVLPRSDIVVTNAFWLPVLISILKPYSGKVVVDVARFPKGQIWLYRRAARLRAPSTAIAEAIRRQSPTLARKVKVIPNPVDLNSFQPPPSAGVQDGKVVLYAGRIHPEKGIDLLVGAFRLLWARRRNVRLRLVGPVKLEQGGGGPGYARKLREAAGDAPVEFLEPISDRGELCREFHRATCFCYPSVAERGESFGVAPLEAMAAGLVPVVSALDCFREFIVPGETGLVFDHRAPDRIERLAAALEAVLFDDALRSRVQAAGVTKAREFGTRHIAEMFLEDFRALLLGATS